MSFEFVNVSKVDNFSAIIFCPDVFLAVDGDERQRIFHSFGCLVTRLNLKIMFHT